MNFFKIILLVLINFMLQITVLSFLSINDVIPNTSLVLVVVFTLLCRENEGSIIAFLSGLMQDITFNTVIGINAFTLLMVSLLVGKVEKKVFKDNLWLPVVMTVLSTGVFYLLQFLFLQMLKLEVNASHLNFSILFKEIIYNTVVAVILYSFLLKKRKEKNAFLKKKYR